MRKSINNSSNALILKTLFKMFVVNSSFYNLCMEFDVPLDMSHAAISLRSGIIFKTSVNSIIVF